jgi:hypothetical protein
MAANEREMLDFEHSLQYLHRPPAESLRFQRSCSARSGMRIGLSSGNASDNWTHTKLRGSAVLNCAIDLSEEAAVHARVEHLDGGCFVRRRNEKNGVFVVFLNQTKKKDVVLESDDAMNPAGLKRGVFCDGKAESIFFANGKKSSLESWCCLTDVSDVSDPLRMLKHALAFVGGNWRGVRVYLCNRGVSRSGFASSSAVAVNLLAALYAACGVSIEPVQLGSLALLFENQLGLKSGRQDVDGPLLPGLKHLVYRPTAGVVEPVVETLHVPLNLMLVDTGVRRPADNSLKRGLNMRHLAFLSREPCSFLSIRKSLGIHKEIVEAVRRSDWPLLGDLFAE